MNRQQMISYAIEFDLSYSLAMSFAYIWGEQWKGWISLSFVASFPLKLKGKEMNGWNEELAFSAKNCTLIKKWGTLFIYEDWCWEANMVH